MSNFTPQQIEEFLQEFFDVVGARQYIGARYVPIFGRAGEDTVEWDDEAPYEPLTVVMHQGVSYVSRRYVPKDIQITDTDYWVETYRFNAQVEQYRQEVLGFADDIADRVPFPDPDVFPKYGEAGQVLSTLGDGATEWVDPVVPDADLTGAAVNAWLDAHPEATTTVEDGSITNAKIHDDTITDEKLVQTGGILSTVDEMADDLETVATLVVDVPHNMLYEDYPVTFESGSYTADFEPQAGIQYARSTKLLYASTDVLVAFDRSNYIVNLNVATGPVGTTRISNEWKYSPFTVDAGTYFWLHVRGATAHNLSDAEIAEINATTTLTNVDAAIPAMDARVTAVEGTVRPVHNVRNVINPATIVEGSYYDTTGALKESATWHCARVAVSPESGYSIYGAKAAYTSFARADGTVISQITSTGTIQTPAGCELMYVSGLAANDLVLVNYPGVASGDYAYDETIRTVIDGLDLSAVPAFADLDADFRANTVDVDDDVLMNANRTVIVNPVMCDTDGFRRWGSWGTVTHNQDGSITYTPLTTNNGGIYSQNLTCPPSNLLRVTSDITQLNCTLRLILFGTRQDSSSATLVMKTYTEPTSVDFTIDLTYQSIYNNLDLTKVMTVGFIVTASTSDGTDVIFDHVTVYDDRYPDLAGKIVTDALVEVGDAASSASNQVSSMSLASFNLVDSDGDRYFLQISNGSVVATPVIPENVVFIGNSLLFGFGTFGMAASNDQEDYYALVTSYLDQHATNPTYTKVYGSPWERSESLAAQETWCSTNLLPELGNDVDLVIIQLGDNVNANTSIAFFEQASKNLVAYIRANAPNARVAWVAEWYSTAQKQEYIANACAMYGATFVDIGMLYADVDNRARIGDVITYPDSSTRVITDPAVASHPSSVGMAKIADTIIETLFE